MTDSIPWLGEPEAVRAEADFARGKIFPFLEYRAVRLEAAVPMQMRPRPQVNLEEAEHSLAVAGHELPPRRLEVARPRLKGEVVAVPVVVERDRLHLALVGGGEELREHHRRVVAREDVAVREGAHVEFLPPRREIHAHPPTPLEKRGELVEERGEGGAVPHGA